MIRFFKIIIFVIAILSFLICIKPLFAFDYVTSPTNEQKWFGTGTTELNLSGTTYLNWCLKSWTNTLFCSNNPTASENNYCIYSLWYNYWSIPIKEFHEEYGNFGSWWVGFKIASFTEGYATYNSCTQTKRLFIYREWFTWASIFLDQKTFFIHNDIVIVIDWNFLKYYWIDDTIFNFTLLQSINKPIGFVNPIYWKIPIEYTLKNGETGWIYEGTDHKIHWLSSNWLESVWSNVTTDWFTPIWPLFFLKYWWWSDYVYLLSDQWTTNSWTYIQVNYTSNIITYLWQWDSWSWLLNISVFQNPKLYFYDINQNVRSWDINCKTVPYMDCRLDVWDWFYYCSDNVGNKSPTWTKCLGAVEWLWGGWSSSWGGWSSGGSSEQIPNLEAQNCIPVTFSGSYSFSWVTENLEPTSCSWQTYSGSYRCQDDYGHLCLTDGDSCLSIISNPEQYATGWTSYNWDVTKYNCASTNFSCLWSNSYVCWPISNCYIDGVYCRVKPELLETTTITTYNTWTITMDSFWSGGISLWFSDYIWTYTGVVSWTGLECEQIFSWSTFLYWGNVSIIDFTFANNFSLSTEEWSCPVFWFDFCNIIYKLINGTLQVIMDSLQDVLNTILWPILDSLSYIFYPVPNNDYCFLGTKLHYEGKINSYTWISDNIVHDTSGFTWFDWFFIFILVAAWWTVIIIK